MQPIIFYLLVNMDVIRVSAHQRGEPLTNGTSVKPELSLVETDMRPDIALMAQRVSLGFYTVN